MINDIPDGRWGFSTGNYDLAIQNDNDGTPNGVGGGAWTTRMLITETGNVGIATTAPAEKLEVNGNINLGMPNVTGTSGGFGNYLFFLGAQGTPGYPNMSNNSDPSWIARYNVTTDQSEVRLNLGDNCNNGQDAFVIQSGGAGACAANTVLFRLDENGNAYKPGGGSWAVLSDIRLNPNFCNIRPYIQCRYCST